MSDRTVDVQTLRDKAAYAAPRSRDFAASLLAQLDRKGSLSDKQWPWVHKLASEMRGEAPKKPSLEVGDMSRVHELFKKAGGHTKRLKRPAIVLMTPSAVEIKLSVAGPNARIPGSINVVDFHSKEWYGRIVEGKWQPSDRVQQPTDLWQLLITFAQNPESTAAAFGRMTGRCCFCNRPLKDERSTAVGYGPVCADVFGLAWGDESFAFTPAQS